MNLPDIIMLYNSIRISACPSWYLETYHNNLHILF